MRDMESLQAVSESGRSLNGFSKDIPKNPSKKRRTSSPPKLLTRAVGTHRITKSVKVIIYGGLRPTAGILVVVSIRAL